MGAVISILFSAHFLSPMFDSDINRKMKKLGLKDEEFEREIIYVRKKEKFYQKTQKRKKNKTNQPFETNIELYKKVTSMVLDSPFTNLFKMIQGKKNNFYL